MPPIPRNTTPAKPTLASKIRTPGLTPPEVTPAPVEPGQPPVWRGKRVTLVKVRGRTEDRVRVDSQTLGGLAVHRTLYSDAPGRWSLSSVTTGLWLCDCTTERDCKRVGELLTERCGASFLLTGPKEIFDSLPTWVPGWVRECRKQKRFVDVRDWVK